MGFMQNVATGGDFKIYCKYNAKAGRFYTKADEANAEEYEVVNFVAAFDFPNIKTGWFLFAPGAAPVKTFDPSLQEAASKPGEGFKRGFELDIWSDKNLGGVREFASTAGAVIDAMNGLYDAYSTAPEASQGKLPVVKCTGVTPVTSKHGTNYAPKFQIVSWVDRPAELGTPAATASAPAPTPAPSPDPVPAGDVDDVEF